MKSRTKALLFTLARLKNERNIRSLVCYVYKHQNTVYVLMVLFERWIFRTNGINQCIQMYFRCFHHMIRFRMRYGVSSLLSIAFWTVRAKQRTIAASQQPFIAEKICQKLSSTNLLTFAWCVWRSNRTKNIFASWGVTWFQVFIRSIFIWHWIQSFQCTINSRNNYSGHELIELNCTDQT